MRDRADSCILAPPEAETMINGRLLTNAYSMIEVSRSPTTDPIDPAIKEKSRTASATSISMNFARAHHGAFIAPRVLLRLFDPFDIGLRIDELQEDRPA